METPNPPINIDKRFPSLPFNPRRKLSIPVAFSAQNIEQIAIRRRFSNVGDAVTRKLSTTIGWRGIGSGKPPEEVVAIGRALCTLYVRSRLKRACVFNRKLGLTRVRSAVGTLTGKNGSRSKTIDDLVGQKTITLYILFLANV